MATHLQFDERFTKFYFRRIIINLVYLSGLVFSSFVGGQLINSKLTFNTSHCTVWSKYMAIPKTLSAIPFQSGHKGWNLLMLLKNTCSCRQIITVIKKCTWALESEKITSDHYDTRDITHYLISEWIDIFSEYMTLTAASYITLYADSLRITDYI